MPFRLIAAALFLFTAMASAQTPRANASASVYGTDEPFPAISTAPDRSQAEWPSAQRTVVPANFERPAEVTMTSESVGRTPIIRGDADSTTAERPPPSREAKEAMSDAAWTSFAALLFVGLIAVVALRLIKQKMPQALGALPREAVEVLGRRRLDARSQLILVRTAGRILVLGSGADGVRTLAEVDDPTDVDHLAGLCRMDAVLPTGAATAFGSMLRKRTAAPAAPSTPRPAPSRSKAELADLPGRRDGQLREGLDLVTP